MGSLNIVILCNCVFIVNALNSNSSTIREDLLFERLTNAQQSEVFYSNFDDRFSNATLDIVDDHPVCRWIGFFMILFYATFVFLIVLLDGLIPRLSEYFGVMERSDSFAADEVRPVPHNLPPMQIEQATPFSPVPPTSVAPPTLTAEQ
ncbi:hypothetical protein Tcan_17955 [Toxocara canis]|uniref:Uncharacterized protein n=1 Tax=Toxocara canis TaxID=6265 RepID=A0A0B2VJ34_TOXCA|nr:hypothetical protein Tcan_17955 [Toxocara canis]